MGREVGLSVEIFVAFSQVKGSFCSVLASESCEMQNRMIFVYICL